MKKHIQSAALKAAFPMTIPVMAGYIFLGISYGVLSRTNGFPIWLPVVTALIIYTGSMEFLMVSILASAFHPMAAFVTAAFTPGSEDSQQLAVGGQCAFGLLCKDLLRKDLAQLDASDLLGFRCIHGCSNWRPYPI